MEKLAGGVIICAGTMKGSCNGCFGGPNDSVGIPLVLIDPSTILLANFSMGVLGSCTVVVLPIAVMLVLTVVLVVFLVSVVIVSPEVHVEVVVMLELTIGGFSVVITRVVEAGTSKQ